MKKKTLQFIWVLMLMNAFSAFGFNGDSIAQKSQKKTLVIEGDFTEQLPKDMAIRYSHGQDFISIGQLSSRDNEYNIPLNKDKFKILLQNEIEYSYLHLGYSLEFKNHKKIPRTNEILIINNFILPASGKLLITISNDTVLFKGDGAELMRCQYEMFAYYYCSRDNIFKAKSGVATAGKEVIALKHNNSTYLKGLVELKETYDNIYNNQMQILERYRKRISEEMYLRLKYDLLGRKMSMLLTNLRFDISNGYAFLNPLLLADLVQFYKDQIWFEKSNFKQDSIAKSKSYFYSMYLHEKSFSDLYIPLAACGSGIRPTFELVYQKLLGDYPKELLNGIFASLFLNPLKGIPNWAYDDALDKITDESVKDFIFNLKQSRSIGLPAFNFSLKDSNNNTITLSDLKGKILVIDFWYTGCMGCAGLARQMGPIIEHYKGNEKVLFVSVSIDRDFEQWKASVRKGIYTHPESLNLYTNGLADDADVIKKYGVNSYPTLLIIDEKGKILSYSPPKPSKDIPSRNSSFMGIINERLEKWNN